MAELRLTRHGPWHDPLPPACLRCGLPAAVRRRRTFWWAPVWAWLIPPLLPVFARRFALPVPLCEGHAGHWSRRLRIHAILGLLTGAGYAGARAGYHGDGPDAGAPEWWLVAAVPALVWAASAAWMRSRAIRAVLISDSEIRLTGVGPGFLEAYETRRLRAGDEGPDSMPG